MEINQTNQLIKGAARKQRPLGLYQGRQFMIVIN
jgi:hypothetical protein